MHRIRPVRRTERRLRFRAFALRCPMRRCECCERTARQAALSGERILECLGSDLALDAGPT